MALIVMDGFDLENASYAVSTNGDGLNWYAGRDGTGFSLASSSTNIFTTGRHVIKSFASGSDTIYGSYGIYATNFNGQVAGGGHQGSTVFCVFADTGTTFHLNVQYANDGKLVLRRGESETGDGTSVVLQTSTLSIPVVAAWHSFQFKVTIHDTLGECIIKMDGIEFINYTGDTKNGGTNTRPDAISIRSKSGQNRWDDLIINDTTGSVNNSWPGDVTIANMRPNADGTYSAFVGSDGNSVNNYLLVNESTLATASYVQSSTTGATDSYNFQPTGKVGTVLAVQPYAYANKTDVGVRGFKFLARSGGGTEMRSSAQAVSNTFLFYPGPIWLTDASGNPWTVANLDNYEFGYEVT